MTFPALTHVAVTVRDLAVSVPWYRALFGADPALDEDTDAGFHHVVWALDNGTLFGIHQHTTAAPDEPFSEFRVGLDHVAFRVCRPRRVGILDGTTGCVGGGARRHRRRALRLGRELPRPRRHRIGVFRTACVVPAPAGGTIVAMCTRVLYVGDDGLVITGRGMDWGEDILSNMWVFPRGMNRTGASGANTVTWTSKFGSLVTSIYEIGTAEGMNDAGLVINALYLTESQYGGPDDRPTMSITTVGQYVLDSFGTVADAVDELSRESFRVIAPVLPNGKPATAHMSLSDPGGDTAIFEWIDGKLKVHHGAQYLIMTNSPPFDEQLAIEKYWQNVDPLTFLPGAINAADRFVRMSFFINAIPKSLDPHTITAVPGGSYQNQAAASVLSAMRAIGVPLGVTHPSKPNIASTLWRTVNDSTNRVVFFDSATSSNTFWVPLADLDFAEGAPVRKLTLTGGRVYAGNAAAQFEPAEPFGFGPAAD